MVAIGLVIVVCLSEAGAESNSHDHWAFKKPARPSIPPAVTSSPARNPIDNFIIRKLEENGLARAEETDRPTLLRRLTFGLHGLPPSPAEINEFARDTRSSRDFRRIARHSRPLRLG